MDFITEKAIEIAKRELRSCYGENGIYAGLNHFKDYWARDMFFACLGAIAIKDFTIVEKSLKLYLKNAKKNGELPIRIGRSTNEIILSLIKKSSFSRKPIFNNDKNNNKSTDQNSLFIIALFEYVKTSKNMKILEHMNEIEKIMLWNFSVDMDSDNLIEENKYCSWADSIKKQGKVLYTNVLHAHALQCLKKLYELKKNTEKKLLYENKAKQTKKSINKLFWNGEYYSDWIFAGKRYDFLAYPPNYLSIIYNITDEEKEKKMQRTFKKYAGKLGSCVYQKYPLRHISKRIMIGGMKDYHNGLSWLWIACLNVLMQNKIKNKVYLKNTIKEIAKIIVEFDGVYEIYDKNKPVNRLFYRSEKPFAWSAAMFLYATNTVFRLKSN